MYKPHPLYLAGIFFVVCNVLASSNSVYERHPTAYILLSLFIAMQTLSWQEDNRLEYLCKQKFFFTKLYNKKEIF